MPGLSVGGITIPVAPGSGSWDWNDTTDRQRAFDNTYRSSATGGAARDGHWTTPPVSRANAGVYRGVLQQVAAQMCSGDLIEIPTMCCAELIRESPVKQSSGSLVVLDFALHEVQGKKLLLKYAPGDTITGESFARSTVGFSRSSAGVLTSNAINAKRDSHYVGSARTLLLEGGRTNTIKQSGNITLAGGWQNFSGIATPTTGIADPSSGTSATELAAANTQSGYYRDDIVIGSAGTRVFYCLVKRTSSARSDFQIYNVTTATVVCQVRHVWDVSLPATVAPTQSIIAGAGTLLAPISYQNGWWLLPVAVTCAANTHRLTLWIDTLSGGGSNQYFGAQGEAGAFASSYIPTTTAALSRGSDSYSLPYTAPPGETSIYLKFKELGTAQTDQARLFEIGSAAGASPRLYGYAESGVYRVKHENGTSVAANVSVAPAYGDTVEILIRLFGDGSVDITQSINGAPATSGTPSGPLAFADAWSGQLLWLNSSGTFGLNGFIGLQSLKDVAGMRSLDDMRAA